MREIKQLFLEQWADVTEAVILAEFAGEWQAAPEKLKNMRVLVARKRNHGYEEDAWALLRSSETGKLFEVFGSHCSCYGFENQFDPEPTSRAYLLSEHFSRVGDATKKIQTWIRENV